MTAADIANPSRPSADIRQQLRTYHHVLIALRYVVLAHIVVEQLPHIATDNGRGHDHFRVEQGMGRVQPMQETTVAVGPIHHGGDAQPPVQRSALFHGGDA